MAKKGIVFVTFNYRLGPLGFLDDRTPSKSSGDRIYNLGTRRSGRRPQMDKEKHRGVRR